MRDFKISPYAQRLLLAVYSEVPHDVTVALAGGACRDFAHGQEPKDYDIVIVGGGRDTLGTIVERLPKHGLVSVQTERFHRYNGDELQERIGYIIKLTLEDGHAVDLLWYHNAVDLEDAIGQFDYSINQFAAWFEWKETDEVSGPELHTKAWPDAAKRICRPVRGDVTEERQNHVWGIASRLRWSWEP